MLDGDRAFLFAFAVFFKCIFRCRMHESKNIVTNCVSELGTVLTDMLCQMVYSALAHPSKAVMNARMEGIMREFAPFPITTAYLTDHVIPLLPQTATSEIEGYTHDRYTNQLVESYNGSAQNALGDNRSLGQTEIVQRLNKLDQHFHDEVCLIFFRFATFYRRQRLQLQRNA
jgi:hypothetical protein